MGKTTAGHLNSDLTGRKILKALRKRQMQQWGKMANAPLLLSTA